MTVLSGISNFQNQIYFIFLKTWTVWNINSSIYLFGTWVIIPILEALELKEQLYLLNHWIYSVFSLPLPLFFSLFQTCNIFKKKICLPLHWVLQTIYKCLKTLPVPVARTLLVTQMILFLSHTTSLQTTHVRTFHYFHILKHFPLIAYLHAFLLFGSLFPKCISVHLGTNCISLR